MSDIATGGEAARAWSHVLIERERAGRAADVAARHEALAVTDPVVTRQLHLRMAAIHRQMEQRHQITVRLYSSLASKLRECGDTSGTHAAQPPIMSATAELAGSAGAIMALFGPDHDETVSLASDPISARAHDLEFQFNEGPSRDAVRTRRQVAAVGRDQLCGRWHLYGPEVADSGVHSVTAVPMEVGTVCLGALTLLNPGPAAEQGEVIHVLGEALTYSMLEAYPAGSLSVLLGDGDHWSAVHQAAGAISVQNSCSIKDAMALIRARAFAEGSAVTTVALGILHGTGSLR